MEETKDLEGLKILNTSKRRIASAVHLVLTAGAYLGLYICFKDLFRATLFYLIGYFLLHLALQRIPNIGFYNPGYYEYWSGGDIIRVASDSYVEYYGFADISVEIFIEAAVYGVVAVAAYYILPTFIFYILLIAAIAIIVLKYIIYPFVNDIINICSRYIVQDVTDTIRDAITGLILILTVVSIVASFFVFPAIMPKTLDMEALLEDHYDDLPNPFAGSDLSTGNITFKQASTVCELNYTGEMVSESGLIKLGEADIRFQNHFTYWKVDTASIRYTGMKVVSPVDFNAETNIEIEGYEGLAIVSAKFDKYENGVGEGTFTVTDKESGDVKFTSKFTTGYRVDGGAYPDEIYIYLETPIDVGYFGYGRLETNIDFDKNTLNLVAFGINLQD
jgi:hypothetical protein